MYLQSVNLDYVCYDLK